MRFPQHDREDIKKARRYLESLITSDTDLHEFLQEYFSHHVHRLGMHLVYLREQLKPGDSWLDVGSFGIEAAVLTQEMPDVTIRALSLEGNRIGIRDQALTEMPDNVRAIQIDSVDVESERFPYGDSCFDLVTCFDVVEHLKSSPVPMMLEIKRVLSPEGRLVLTTPNTVSYASVRRMLSGWPPQHCPFYHRSLKYGVIHPKEDTVEEVHNLLSCLGFVDIELSTFDSRPMTKSEQAAALLCKSLELLRNSFRKGTKQFYRGESIQAVASKGGAVISETPELIFGPDIDRESP